MMFTKKLAVLCRQKTVQRKNKMVRFTNVELKQLDQLLKKMNSENTHWSSDEAWHVWKSYAAAKNIVVDPKTIYTYTYTNWRWQNSTRYSPFYKFPYFRCSHSERCSYEKVFWKYVANLLENTKCWNAISIKLLCNFIEITLRHGCSPANSLHIFRTPFLKNISGWPLLSFNNLIKGVCFLRDNKTVIGRGDDGYQIYSVSQSNIQLVGYYLSRLNKFWYPPSPCSITV